jgi:hypothetical protein
MMLQNAHGPIPIVTFPGDRRSLGFVLVLPSLHRPRGKMSSPVSQKVPRKRAPAEKLQDKSLGLLVSIGFVCYLLFAELLRSIIQ